MFNVHNAFICNNVLKVSNVYSSAQIIYIQGCFRYLQQTLNNEADTDAIFFLFMPRRSPAFEKYGMHSCMKWYLLYLNLNNVSLFHTHFL